MEYSIVHDSVFTGHHFENDDFTIYILRNFHCAYIYEVRVRNLKSRVDIVIL